VTRPLRLGVSTCPNDTFAFHALLSGAVDPRGLTFDVTFDDVEALNEGLHADRFDLTKASFHAMLPVGDRFGVLPVGSALGHGVGPLVLAPRGAPPRPGTTPRVLTPGRWTTAALLWSLYHPEAVDLQHVVFSDIMPALERGEADYGICIHEGRFTWHERDLERIEDLGETWQTATGELLPLGGIAARLDLGPDLLGRFSAALRDSIQWGLQHREACLASMAGHAQELTEAVLWAHVDLYVNEWTLDLGQAGSAALNSLWAQTSGRGLLQGGAPAPQVLVDLAS